MIESYFSYSSGQNKMMKHIWNVNIDVPNIQQTFYFKIHTANFINYYNVKIERKIILYLINVLVALFYLYDFLMGCCRKKYD